MNKFNKIFLLAIIFAMAAFACQTASVKKDEGDKKNKAAEAPSCTIQLLHFADVDGNEDIALDSVDEFSALVDGFKKDADYGANTIFVCSGDHIIQGPRFYAAEKIKKISGSDEPGSADISLMNAMGVQAATIGNHELDAGPGELKDAINKDIKAAFPHLSANIDFSKAGFKTGKDGDEADSMQGLVAKYAVVIVDNQKIGIVGAVTPTLPAITSVGSLLVITPDTNDIDRLAAVIQTSVDELKNMGINKIILLAHMQQISVEKTLAAKLDGVDIIVAGGSNTRMGDDNDTLFPGDSAFTETYPYKTKGKDGNPALVVNVDGDYKYLGRLVVSFDKNGAIMEKKLDPAVNGAYPSVRSTVSKVKGTVNENVIAVRDAIKKVIDDQYSNIVGYANVYLDGRRSQVRTQETNLGNLTADANLWYANKLSPEAVGPVHISLKNGGGIRTEIGSATIPPGSTDKSKITYNPPKNSAVTEGHLKASLRFDNGLVILKATPEELKDLLEHAVAATSAGATPGRFPQISGMKITYNLSGKARTEKGNGTRIKDITIFENKNGIADESDVYDQVYANGKKTAAKKSYRLVTLNFLANGGDDYPFDNKTWDRYNLYSGKGYGEETDYQDGNLAKDTDNGFGFSKTGREQDALADYMKEHHGTKASAYAMAETDKSSDKRIVKK